MKLNFGKKLVLFLHWLLSLIVCALAAALCFVPEITRSWLQAFDQLIGGWGDIAGIAALALYVLLAVLSVAFIFSNKKKRVDRNFITVDNNEAGRTRIAIAAVDQMVRQAVRGVEGIVDLKCSITNLEDAININAAVSIVGGAHIPTVTMNIQRAVRSYIELNCGVAVREVCVSVNALENAEEGSRKRGRGHASAAPAPAAIQEYEPVAAPAAVEAPAAEAEEAASAAEEMISEETE